MNQRAAAGDPFNALGDANRRAIVAILRGGEKSVQEVADALPISRPAVSRHLRLLKDAGLVTDRADGSRRLCRLDESGLDDMLAYLDSMWGDASTRFRVAVENLSEREDGK
jgi:DNA-binding transcriptional ArsR family regulator